MGDWVVSVGFNRPTQPRGCLLVAAEMQVGDTHEMHPEIHPTVARGEPDPAFGLCLIDISAGERRLSQRLSTRSAAALQAALRARIRALLVLAAKKQRGPAGCASAFRRYHSGATGNCRHGLPDRSRPRFSPRGIELLCTAHGTPEVQRNLLVFAGSARNDRSDARGSDPILISGESR